MDLTTLARVRELLAFDGGDTSQDSTLSKLIASYSQIFEREMNRHAEVAARTEVYRLPQGRRRLSLRGAPLTSNPTTVKYDWSRDFTSATTLTRNTDYVVDLTTGSIEFLFYPSIRVGYIEVVYSAGMAADTDAFVTAYPAIAEAMDAQVVYHFNRRQDPAGSKVVEGGSSTYFGELKLLKRSRQAIGKYKRLYL